MGIRCVGKVSAEDTQDPIATPASPIAASYGSFMMLSFKANAARYSNGCGRIRGFTAAGRARTLRSRTPSLEVSLRYGWVVSGQMRRATRPPLSIDPDRTKTRHSGHLDTIFDYPEELARLTFVRNLLEVRRIRIQAFGKLLPFHPRAPWQLAQPRSENARAPARTTSRLSRSTGLVSRARRPIDAIRIFISAQFTTLGSGSLAATLK